MSPHPGEWRLLAGIGPVSENPRASGNDRTRDWRVPGAGTLPSPSPHPLAACAHLPSRDHCSSLRLTGGRLWALGGPEGAPASPCGTPVLWSGTVIWDSRHWRGPAWWVTSLLRLVHSPLPPWGALSTPHVAGLLALSALEWDLPPLRSAQASPCRLGGVRAPLPALPVPPWSPHMPCTEPGQRPCLLPCS